MLILWLVLIVKRTLSLIIPVRNAEQSLAQDVARILDVLPELTKNFEVLIVDQDSTDHTREIAEDLRWNILRFAWRLRPLD